MTRLPHWNFVRMVRRAHAIGVTLFLGLTTVIAQAPKVDPKPTEKVIKQYEKFIADGSLLTPEGWNRVSRLFERLGPYPANGEIQIVSTGGLIGENWVRGDEAEVETKWDDFYGTIDATLRFKPAAYSGILMGWLFAMVRAPQQPGSGDPAKATGVPGSGEWKIKGPQSVRFATIPAAIKYVEEMRDRSDDPRIRMNAERTIAALKRLINSRGNACAC